MENSFNNGNISNIDIINYFLEKNGLERAEKESGQFILGRKTTPFSRINRMVSVRVVRLQLFSVLAYPSLLPPLAVCALYFFVISIHRNSFVFLVSL